MYAYFLVLSMIGHGRANRTRRLASADSTSSELFWSHQSTLVTKTNEEDKRGANGQVRIGIAGKHCSRAITRQA